MLGLIDTIRQTDAVGQLVALLLLLMSLASWVVILWKARVLWLAKRQVAQAVAAFWQAPDLSTATQRIQGIDSSGLVLQLVESTRSTEGQTLAAQTDRANQLTRVLRDALHAGLARLQYGQVLLATVGSTAPFVGLLGTVWGIYHALVGLSGAGQVSIDKISAPVGEALIMTAAGLAVAIPAVLAYNVFGKTIANIEADLEGFAFDLRELIKGQRP
jgi:biopolymer transport protein ExbB